jgi:hypothetical protein
VGSFFSMGAEASTFGVGAGAGVGVGTGAVATGAAEGADVWHEVSQRAASARAGMNFFMG